MFLVKNCFLHIAAVIVQEQIYTSDGKRGGGDWEGLRGNVQL